MAQQIDWTRLDPLVRRLARDGVSPGGIASMLGLSRGAVRGRIASLERDAPAVVCADLAEAA
ncbi:hypothetical protein HLH33_13015 [Gluconacetobacter diazotrophicus]|uniref:AsnC family transcriptional regulator n=1 Tax=Gluconacetobacter diazotrophicus TaxID=33996 RepID=A0A7W4I6K7_GLUDI|nr:hypothetical protein [Gluconacetobacter diazotrophicus]MBB2157220.1 hypothetical protein [Gluconacetobacter diazotrophicus]